VPLVSSGQIKLSDIRNEYALGSGQIAMSQLYGKGNAAASGQIQMAANFYGTSNITYLVNGTITSGRMTAKTSVIHTGYSTKVHNTGGTIGSKSLTTNSGLTHVVDVDNNDGTFASNRAFITLNAAGSADLWYAKIGNTTYNRRLQQIVWSTGIQSATDHTGGGPAGVLGAATWVKLNGFFGLSNGSTTTVQIAKMDEATWLDTTLTVGHFTRQDNKGNNFPCRGFLKNGTGSISSQFPTGSIGGSIGSNTFSNPDNNSNPGWSIRQIVGMGGSQGGGSGGSLRQPRQYFQLDGSSSSSNFKSRCRGVLLTKSGGAKLWIPSEALSYGNSVKHHPSSLSTGATIVDFSVGTTTHVVDFAREVNSGDIYNFFSTNGEQINLKVY
jgi:hypothetical protein